VPPIGQLPELSAAAARAFTLAAHRMIDAGAELLEVDFAPFLEVGALLYEGAFVAERHAAVGAFVAAHPQDVDPTVAAIIASGGVPSASALARDVELRDELRVAALAAIEDVDVLLAPTAPSQPTIAAVADDPIGANSRLGVYTNFCNLLGMCAVAVPAGEADGGSFGVTFFGRPFADRVVADVAGMLAGPAEPALAPPAVELLVVDADEDGRALRYQLAARGGRLARADEGAGELWLLPPAELANVLALLPSSTALDPRPAR
jgi:allophanate hydrolase